MRGDRQFLGRAHVITSQSRLPFRSSHCTISNAGQRAGQYRRALCIQHCADEVRVGVAEGVEIFQEPSLVVEHRDLPVELARGPVLVGRLIPIPLPVRRIFNRHQRPIALRAQFITSRVTNWLHRKNATRRVSFRLARFETQRVSNPKHTIKMSHFTQVRDVDLRRHISAGTRFQCQPSLLAATRISSARMVTLAPD